MMCATLARMCADQTRRLVLATELRPGDKIVRGHVFPRTLYTGTVEKTEEIDTTDRLRSFRIVCEDGQWACAPSDQYEIEVTK